MKKQTVIWILAVIVTIGTAYYQRKTGPTYPVKFTTEVAGSMIETSLSRSHGGETDKEIRIAISDPEISGKIIYKRFKTADVSDTILMTGQGTELIASLPHQPPAGKLEYRVVLYKDNIPYPINDTPVVIRFKGNVPAGVLIPHILFIFAAQLLSLVAGVYAIFKLGKFKLYGKLTVIFLIIGGFVLGPVIQKFAFGAYWTGFPFGQDMTDNKVLLALVIWIIAIALNFKKNRPRLAIIAAIVFFLVNMIPHSMFGSELDYESGEVLTGMIMLF